MTAACGSVATPENCTRQRGQRHSFVALLLEGTGTHGRQQDQGGGVLGKLGRLPSHVRHPTVTETMVQRFARDPAPCCSAIKTCVASWIEAGLEVPVWSVLREYTTAVRADVLEPSEPKFGWQEKATGVSTRSATTERIGQGRPTRSEP